MPFPVALENPYIIGSYQVSLLLHITCLEYYYNTLDAFICELGVGNITHGSDGTQLDSSYEN